MGTMAQALLPLISSIAVRGSLVLGLFLLALAALRPGKPGLRHTTVTLALLLSLGVSFLGAAGLSLPGAVLLSVPEAAVSISAPAAAVLPTSDASQASIDPEGFAPGSFGIENEAPASSPRPDIAEIAGIAISLAWLAGIALILAWRISLALMTRRRLGRNRVLAGGRIAEIARELAEASDLGSLPRIYLSESVNSPFCIGVFWNSIYLPASSESWDEWTLRSVLAHELGHCGRRDGLWMAFARVLALPAWFSPLSWISLKVMEADREAACDQAVLRLGTAPSSYASLLLGLSARRVSGPLSVACMARPSGTGKRIRAILSQEKESKRSTNMKKISLAAILILAAASTLSLDKGPAAAAVESPRLIDPLGSAEYRRVREFGPYADPFLNGKTSFCRGIAMATDRGTPVRSVMEGRVVVVASMTDVTGMYLIIDGSGFRAKYWNLDSILVREGQNVDAGEPIAVAGNAWSIVFDDGTSLSQVTLELSPSPGKEAGPEAGNTWFDPARLVAFTQPPAPSGLWNPDPPAPVTVHNGSWRPEKSNGGWLFEPKDAPASPVTGTIYSGKDGLPALSYRAKSVRSYYSPDKRQSVTELTMEDGSVITITR